MLDGMVRFSDLKRALKAMHPHVVIKNDLSLHRGTMVYLSFPRHPDSDPVTGLWEVLAIPSPIFFDLIPKHDVEWKDPITGQGKWVRGWSTFFKSVRRMKDPTGQYIFPPSKVRRWFNDAYDRFSSNKFKADLNERNTPETLKLARMMRDERYVFDPRHMPSGMGV